MLKRWRQRKMAGYTFAGSRLSSTIRRALDFAFPELVTGHMTPSVDEILKRVEEVQVAMKRRYLSLPHADVLRTLLLDLGPDWLRQLTRRHTSESHRGRSGVPDLYLFARSGSTAGKPAFSLNPAVASS